MSGLIENSCKWYEIKKKRKTCDWYDGSYSLFIGLTSIDVTAHSLSIIQTATPALFWPSLHPVCAVILNHPSKWIGRRP